MIFLCTGNSGKLTEFKQLITKQYALVGIPEVTSATSLPYLEPQEDADCFLANGFMKFFAATKFVETYKTHLHNHLLPQITQVMVDDSGLCVPALKFIPGVHSANFSGSKDAESNRSKLRLNISKSEYSYPHNNELRLEAFFVCFLFSGLLSDDFTFFKDYEIFSAKVFENSTLLEMERKILTDVRAVKVNGGIVKRLPCSLFYPHFPKDVFIKVGIGFCHGEVSNTEQNLIPAAGHGYDAMFYPLNDKDLSFASMHLPEKNLQSHRAFAVQAWKNA